MRIDLILHHGERANAPSEATRHPCIELLASTAAERDRLKVLADQLAQFGSVPFQFHELEGTSSDLVGARLWVALCEREREGGGPAPTKPEKPPR
jgi:hypothetical protein